jgi:uncharacterized membrane protein SirB2
MAGFYLPLLGLHAMLAVASPMLFSLRAAGALAGEPPQGWLRIAPHVVDTFLLAAGLSLAFTIRQYPFVNGWLTAKLCALIVYIVLGHIAVRRARSRQGRLAAWIGAIAVLLYIYAVAFTKNPTPGLG